MDACFYVLGVVLSAGGIGMALEAASVEMRTLCLQQHDEIAFPLYDEICVSFGVSSSISRIRVLRDDLFQNLCRTHVLARAGASYLVLPTKIEAGFSKNAYRASTTSTESVIPVFCSIA